MIRSVNEPKLARRSAQRSYEFPPGVVVRIIATRRDVLSYFDGEYGRLAGGRSSEYRLDVYVGNYRQAVASLAPEAADWLVYRRRHKVTMWTIALSGLDDKTTRVVFDARGVMTLPYLQNFYLEPLLRLKLLQMGHALVHASSVMKGTKSVLFPGGSRVGKTTLVLRHAALGRATQGDNYAIVSPEGETFAFPRRLRVYSDLRDTMPDVYRGLPFRERARLRLTGCVKNLSLGYANPASRLSLEQFVPDCTITSRARLDSVFVLSPHGGRDLTGPTSLTLDQLIARIQAHGVSEGRWLAEVIAPYLAAHPKTRLLGAAKVERDVLATALKGLPAFEVLVPRMGNAGTLAREICRISGLDEAAEPTDD